MSITLYCISCKLVLVTVKLFLQVLVQNLLLVVIDKSSHALIGMEIIAYSWY